MNDLALICSSLKSRWLNSLLSVLLTAFGVMLALLIIQFGQHVQNRLSADGQGIDIVVGAKGSPLQLILSSVYHIDIPTGNIPYEDAQKWMKHPQVKSAIPLALGDNWKGFRIVGTNDLYPAHYGAALSEGRSWTKPFEAVVGVDVGLSVGDKFNGAHGLMDDGHVHDNEYYKVTGTLEPTGTILDRLILTSLDSVLEIHGQEGVEHGHEHHEEDEHHDHDDHDHHDHDEHDHDEHGHDEHGHDGHDHHEHHDHEEHEKHVHEDTAPPEITALLITTKSPIANINLPRMINRESQLQAANPALEMTRLTSMLGLGSKSFAALSALLIIIAAISIFAGLAGSLENRMGDLAILRALGYSKSRLFKIITLEGLFITFGGIALGFAFGMLGFSVMTNIVTPLSASGAVSSFTLLHVYLILAVLAAGLIASLLPAIRAAKVDVAKQLSSYS